MSESARIREVRQELAELRDPGAHDGPGHDLFLILQKSYSEELELLGAPIQPEEPRRPLPHHPVKPATKPAVSETKPAVSETKPPAPDPIPTQEMRHADNPGHAGAPGAAPLPGSPMPKKPAKTDEEKALAKREYHRRWYAKKHPKAPSKQSAPPQQLGGAQKWKVLMPPEAEPMVLDRTGYATPLRALGACPPPQDALPEAAQRLRALRAQALEILPLCEGLSREDGYAVRHQIDLLAEVLAMADRLAREAS